MVLGMSQTEARVQGSSPFSVRLARNQALTSRKAGRMIRNGNLSPIPCYLPNPYWLKTRWKFTRGLVFDGNFSAEQLQMKHPEDDVRISDGKMFLVTDAPYMSHLKVAKELKEVRE
jgi:hypothetical protein